MAIFGGEDSFLDRKLSCDDKDYDDEEFEMTATSYDLTQKKTQSAEFDLQEISTNLPPVQRLSQKFRINRLVIEKSYTSQASSG